MSKPLLASEVLRDEAAPLEPARRAAQLWLASTAVAMAALELLVGSEPAAAGWAWVGAAVVLAALPLPYAGRAALLLLLGAAALALGLRGLGPLARIGGAEPARLMAAVALPAAIGFRGHYRRFWPAHVALALALLASAPYALDQVRVLLRHGFDWPDGPFALAGLTAVLVAPLVLIPQLRSSHLALIALAGLGLELFGRLASVDFRLAAQHGVALIAAASLASLGLFQLLAWASAGRARRQLQVTPETDEELEQRISVG